MAGRNRGAGKPPAAVATAEAEVIDAREFWSTNPPVALEVRASRQTFRRAGFVFGSTEWTRLLEGEVSVEQFLELLKEPVLTIRGIDSEGRTIPLPSDLRARLVEALGEEEETPTA